MVHFTKSSMVVFSKKVGKNLSQNLMNPCRAGTIFSFCGFELVKTLIEKESQRFLSHFENLSRIV